MSRRKSLKDASLQALDKPKKLYLKIFIVKDGEAKALIVTPDEREYVELAEAIRERVKEITGVSLRVLGEGCAKEEDYRPFNLILLGNIMNNRLLLPLYTHYYAFSDALFPGEGGYELRTIHDPWGDGRGVIFIGATDIEGTKRGTEEFLKILSGGPTLSVDRIIQVKLGKDAERRIRAEAINPSDEIIRRIEAKAVAAMESEAHGNLAPYLSTAGIMYYLTGNDAYAELFKRLAYLYESYSERTLTSTRIEFGRWGFDADFFLNQMMPAWDLVEESPVFTEEDRLKITKTMAKFVEHVPPHTRMIDISEDDFVKQRPGSLSWKIKADDNIRSNHATFAALGLTYAGTYFAKYYRAKEADLWLELADKVFSGQAKASKPTENADGYQWYTLYHTLRYSLARPFLYYLESGNARIGADLAIICTDNLGYQVPYGDTEPYYGWWTEIPFLRGAAYYYKDGRYQWIIEKKMKARSEVAREVDFVGQWPIISTRPGLEICEYAINIEPKEPTDLLGVRIFPLDRAFFNFYGKDVLTPFEKTFDKLVMRESYDPQKQYLLLDGLSCGGHHHPDGNSILRITDRNRILLDDCTYRLSQVKHHNTLLVIKDGQTDKIPPFCELEHLADLKHIGFSETSVKGYSGVDWYRNIIWVKEKYFVVMDEVEAKEDNEYSFHLIWRTVGIPIKEADSLTVDQKGVSFTIQNLDGAVLKYEDDLEAGRSWEGYRYADPVVHVMRQVSDVKLRAGERHTLMNLLYTSEKDDKPVKAAMRTGKNQILIQEDEVTYIGVNKEGDTARLNLLGEDIPPLETDASIYYVSPTRFALVNTTHLTWGDSIMKSSSPISVELDMESESAVIDTAAATEITLKAEISNVKVDGEPVEFKKVEGIKFHLGAGRHNLSLKGLREAFFVSGLRTRFPSVVTRVTAVKLPTKSFGLTMLWSQKADFGQRFTSIFAVDMDRDRKADILAGSTDGRIYAFNSDGTELWTFNTGGEVNSIWASDIDGDGEIEVLSGSKNAMVYLLSSKGSEKWRYHCPDHTGQRGAVTTVFAADLNGDGKEEVIAGSSNWLYYAFKTDGSLLWSYEAVWPSTVGCAADIDGDGKMEVLAGTQLALNAVNFDGSRKWRFSMSGFGKGRVLDVHAEDIDKDGKGETLYACADGNLYVVEYMGKLKWKYNVGEEATQVAVADMDKDGSKEVIVGSISFNIYLLKNDGRRIWRRNVGDRVQALDLGDVDGDGKIEIVVGGSNRAIQIIDGRGDEKARYNTEASVNQIVTADLDGDGMAEIITITEDGRLLALKTQT